MDAGEQNKSFESAKPEKFPKFPSHPNKDPGSSENTKCMCVYNLQAITSQR